MVTVIVHWWIVDSLKGLDSLRGGWKSVNLTKSWRCFWPKKSECHHGSSSGLSPMDGATGNSKTQLIVIVLFVIIYTGSRRLSRLLSLLNPLSRRLSRAVLVWYVMLLMRLKRTRWYLLRRGWTILWLVMIKCSCSMLFFTWCVNTA